MHNNKQHNPPRTNAGPYNEITMVTLQIGHKFDKQPWSNEPDQLNYHLWQSTTTSSTTTQWQTGRTLLCPYLTPPLPGEEPSLHLKSRSAKWCQKIIKVEIIWRANPSTSLAWWAQSIAVSALSNKWSLAIIFIAQDKNIWWTSRVNYVEYVLVRHGSHNPVRKGGSDEGEEKP
jgi:hypothetical protein